MIKYIIPNFICTMIASYAFDYATLALLGTLPTLLSILFLVLYTYACFRFILHYRKNFQSLSLKYGAIAFFGGFYYLLNFKIFPNESTSKIITEEMKKGRKG